MFFVLFQLLPYTLPFNDTSEAISQTCSELKALLPNAQAEEKPFIAEAIEKMSSKQVSIKTSLFT